MEENKKLNMNKVKQVALIVLAIILLGVGFINYNPEENVNSQIALVDNEDMIGDVQLVNSNAIVENENIDSLEVAKNKEEILSNQDLDNNYFEATRLQRDAMYSKMLEAYQKILDNENIVETQKAIAIEEISNITHNQNSIMIAENLIKNKGYEDVVILVNKDIINVVVKTVFLGNEDIGKIQNVIEREFNVDLAKVNISNRK